MDLKEILSLQNLKEILKQVEWKKVRRIVALVSGILMATVSTLFMLFLDAIVKMEVMTLFGLALGGLLGGILQVVGCVDSTNEENKMPTILFALAFIATIGLICTVFALPNNEIYAKYFAETEKTGLISTFYWINIVSMFINLPIVSLCLITCGQEYFGYLSAKSEKAKKIIGYSRLGATGLGGLVSLVGILIGLFFPLIEVMTRVNDTVNKVYTDTYITYQGPEMFFGGNLSLDQRVEIDNRFTINVSPDEIIFGEVQFAATFNVFVFTAFLLIVVGIVFNIVLSFIKNNKWGYILRGVTSLVAVVGSLLLLNTNAQLQQSIGLEEGASVAIKSGLTWMIILSIAGSIILAISSLIGPNDFIKKNEYEIL